MTHDFPPTRSEWGQYAQKVCARVLDEWCAMDADERTERRLRSMLREAYPFDEREHHPYQMWLRQQQATLWLAGFSAMPEWVRRQRALAVGHVAYVPPKEQLTMDLESAR